MRPGPALLILASLFVAGCTTPHMVQRPGTSHEAHVPMADCFAGSHPMTGGACVAILDAPGGRDREASLATHPTDPGTLLATWRVGEFSSEPTIAAAFSSDGGAHWNITTLHDPALQDLPAGSHYSYDSIARFGPDGTAYVLYGGEYRYVAQPPVYLFPEFRMTLASTKDGLSWNYQAFDEMPASAAGPDYMDLAVAPDTGRLIATAQVFGFVAPLPIALTEGIWTWTSDDGGATWTLPTVVLKNDPTGLAAPYHYLPRLAAGPGGLVLLTTTSTRGEGEVTASRDGGTTWGEPAVVHHFVSTQGSAINSPAAVWRGDGQVEAALVYGDGSQVTGYRSSDGGATWSAGVPLLSYPNATAQVWLRAEARDGNVWAGYRFGSDHPKEFGAGMLRWNGTGVQAVRLADYAQEGAWVIGDDYGAVSVAVDGSAWMAWSDPRDADGERVDVAHVVVR